MVDAVTTQLYDGARNVTVKLTNISDGTGEVLVKKLDVTTLNPNPGTHMKVKRVRYSVAAGGVALFWEGTPNTPIVTLAEGNGNFDFSKVFSVGYPDNASSPTGNILLSTSGFVPGSAYTIELELVKGVSLN